MFFISVLAAILKHPSAYKIGLKLVSGINRNKVSLRKKSIEHQ